MFAPTPLGILFNPGPKYRSHPLPPTHPQGALNVGERFAGNVHPSERIYSCWLQDEDGNDLPKDDMSPYSPKQKYVFLKMLNPDPEKQKEYEAVVATKDKDVLRAYINSQVGKNATYAWTRITT